MSLESIQIRGLRCFKQSQTIRFAIPDGKPGSGLTFLVGPNNSGKSTVVDALRVFTTEKPASFTVGKRNKEGGDSVSIILTASGGKTTEIRSVEAGGSESTWVPATTPIPQYDIYVLPSRRYFAPSFGRGLWGRHQFVSAHGLPPVRGAVISGFENRLFLAQQNRPKFDALLSRIVNPVPKWRIDQDDSGNYFVKIISGTSHHPSDGLGDGLLSLLFIVDALYDAKPSEVITIDEPELSLHPSLQRRLASVLIELAAEQQIIISTHSPYFTDFGAMVNGARVIRTVKRGNEVTVHAITSATASRLAPFLEDKHNPHVLGLDAREVFFLEDEVILVEGQEDVMFWRALNEQVPKPLKGTFYGWGVGGADKMETITAMLQELGFQSVVGLLDRNRTDVATRLQERFPQFLFRTLPADDIRTKPARQARGSVRGVLDEAFTIRPCFRDQVEFLVQTTNAWLECSPEDRASKSPGSLPMSLPALPPPTNLGSPA